MVLTSTPSSFLKALRSGASDAIAPMFKSLLACGSWSGSLEDEQEEIAELSVTAILHRGAEPLVVIFRVAGRSD